MPRIRTIKPEFWSSPDTARASLIARLTYIGMWNWADDYGRGTLNLKELEGFIFPNDDVSELSVGTSENFRRVVKEVVDVFGLEVYEVDRRTYYAIPSWSSHQRTERKAKSKYPAPEEGENVTDQWSEGSSDAKRRKLREVPTQGGGSFGKEEHRNRGTGEGISENSDAVTDTAGTGKSEPPQAYFDSVDALAAAHTHTHPTQAFGTIDDPRCAEHKDLDRAPACWECKQAGDILKAQAEEERAERRAQIDACNQCDDNGWVIGTNPAVKCTHQPPLKAVGGPF